MQIRELSNGIIIQYIHSDTTDFDIRFVFDVGSFYENDKNAGVSHMLEHMISCRCNESYSTQTSIKKFLSSINGNMNALTTHHVTAYEYTCPNNNYNKLINFCYKQIMFPIFDNYKKEHNIVKQEWLNQYDGNNQPLDIEEEMIAQFISPPYGRDIAGTYESLQVLTKKMVIAWYKQYYIPKNLTIYISSGENIDNIVHYLENTFGTIPISISSDEKTRCKLSTVQSLFLERNYSQTRLDLMFPVADHTPADARYIETMVSLLNLPDTTGILYHLREVGGLVYSIDVDSIITSDVGMIQISMLTDKPIKTIQACIKFLKQYSKNFINLYKYKKIIKPKNVVDVLLKNDDIKFYGIYQGHLYDKPHYNTIPTHQQMIDFSNKLFSSNDRKICVSGKQNLPDVYINKFLKGVK